MGRIGCVHCEKLWCNFVARTSSLIAPVQPILHQFLCNNETLPNARNTTKMHQNMRLGSNGVDRVRSLPKIPMRVRGTNFCFNCTSSAYFTSIFMQKWKIQNAPKHYKTHQFMNLASNGVDRVYSLRKTLMQFLGTNFFINCTSSTHFATSSV